MKLQLVEKRRKNGGKNKVLNVTASGIGVSASVGIKKGSQWEIWKSRKKKVIELHSVKSSNSYVLHKGYRIACRLNVLRMPLGAYAMVNNKGNKYTFRKEK